MSLVIPPGFGLAAFVFTGNVGTAPYVTTLGLDLSNVGGDHVLAANAAMSAYQTAFQVAWSDALTLDHVTLSVGSDGPGGSVDSDAIAQGGQNSGNMAPSAMSVICRKVTNSLGRGGRGRMFLPGMIDEAGIEENGALTSTVRAQLQGHVDDFHEQLMTDLAPAGFPAIPPVLLHSEGSASTTPSPIQGFQVAPLVGWIRGRIR